jgi:hypothetical protein
VYSVYSVVSYPLKFSTAEGSKKWEFIEAENRTVFYGLSHPTFRRSWKGSFGFIFAA